LTEIVGLDANKIYVSAFIGDERYKIPRDDETAQIWQKVFEEKGIEAKIIEIGSQENGDKRGIKPGERIFFYDDNENWWSRGGGLDKTPIGDPCGPDSEVFMILARQIITTVLAWLIQLVIVGVFLRLVIRSLCNISAKKTAVLSHLKRKMLILWWFRTYRCCKTR